MAKRQYRIVNVSGGFLARAMGFYRGRGYWTRQEDARVYGSKREAKRVIQTDIEAGYIQPGTAEVQP